MHEDKFLALKNWYVQKDGSKVNHIDGRCQQKYRCDAVSSKKEYLNQIAEGGVQVRLKNEYKAAV